MKFKSYMNESIQDTTGVAVDAEIIRFVLDSFNIATQTHIYHLLTKSYAEHMAIGEFYEAIRGSVDVIAEAAIGLNISTQSENYANNLTFSYDKGIMLSQINAYRTNVANLIGATNHNTLMSINDEFITIQKSIDTLLYKLQLS